MITLNSIFLSTLQMEIDRVALERRHSKLVAHESHNNIRDNYYLIAHLDAPRQLFLHCTEVFLPP